MRIRQFNKPILSLLYVLYMLLVTVVVHSAASVESKTNITYPSVAIEDVEIQSDS